jgi:hypothetical protein
LQVVVVELVVVDQLVVVLVDFVQPLLQLVVAEHLNPLYRLHREQVMQ